MKWRKKARVVYRSFDNFSRRSNRGVSRRSGLRSYAVGRPPRDGVIKPVLEVSSRNRSFTLTTVTTRKDSFARITLCTIHRYLSSFDNFSTNYEPRNFRLSGSLTASRFVYICLSLFFLLAVPVARNRRRTVAWNLIKRLRRLLSITFY